MSEFSNLFTDAVKASGLSLREAEKATGLDHSALSRLMSGEIAPSETSLVKLVTKFQPGTAVGHELLFAYFRDTAKAVGLPPENLRIMLADKPAPFWERLPAGLRASFELLATEAQANQEFAALMNDWATVVRGHHAALGQKVYPFSSETAARAVAEPRPSRPSKGHRRPGSAPAVPRGASQEPTA